jgi:hypothetical protein
MKLHFPDLPRVITIITSCLFGLHSISFVKANELIPLQNPSFEEAGPDGVEGWTMTAEGPSGRSSRGVATKAEFKQDLENAKDGEASLLILHEGPRHVTVQQNVLLESGSTYRLRVFAKTDAIPPVRVRFIAELSRTNSLGDEEIIHRRTEDQEARRTELIADGNWNEVVREFIVPDTFATDQNARLQFRAILNQLPTEPVHIWLDDVRLERIDPGSENQE